MTNENFRYNELSREEIVAHCMSLHADGRQWHFHSLTPNCRFNPKQGRYCFIIEDSETKEIWCTFADSNYTSECNELVQVLHGETILSTSDRDENAQEAAIIKSVREAVECGEDWHHHMMKPNCVLSPNPVLHVISLERSSTPEFEFHESDHPPDDVLREIELLYFEGKK